MSLDVNRLSAYNMAIFDLWPEIDHLLAKGGLELIWLVVCCVCVCSCLDEKATLLWHFLGRNKFT